MGQAEGSGGAPGRGPLAGGAWGLQGAGRGGGQGSPGSQKQETLSLAPGDRLEHWGRGWCLCVLDLVAFPGGQLHSHPSGLRMLFPHSGKFLAFRGPTGVDPASAPLGVGKGRAGPQEPLNLASGPAVRFALDAACRSPGLSHARCPSSGWKQKTRGASPTPRGEAVTMENASSLQGCALQAQHRSPRGPPPRATQSAQSVPRGGRLVRSPRCQSTAEGPTVLPGPPATLASDLALPVPAGSLTSVFVRLPCGGVGVSVPVMCT